MMTRLTKSAYLFFFLVLFGSHVFANDLTIKSAYIVNGVEGLEPSGLDLCGGRLLFVSDKHEDVIYELKLNDTLAEVVPYLSLKNVPEPPPQKFPIGMRVKRFIAEILGKTGGKDWEGLSCNEQGDIFLASEYYFSVLKISESTLYEWVVDDLYKTGASKGLFQVNNAFLEGVNVKDQDITLVAERQPRAIITQPADGALQIHLKPSDTESSEKISLDYTGLDYYEGNIFVLDRNRYEVCRRNPPDYLPTLCYSFKTDALSNDWGYDTGIYGLAEGIAIDNEDIWIIMDNNKDSRLASADDKRPTLMRFKNPYQN